MGRATDFSNCYIYHIVDKESIVHYVGSTSNLNSRRSKHKYNCRTEKCKEYNFDIYKYIRDNGGFDKFEIIPIQKIENVSNKTELRIAEQHEINKFSGLKNKIGSYLSEEERVIQHTELCKKWNKEHSENKKQWYQANKEKVAEYNHKYKKTNREKISEYNRKYRQQKKELKQTDQ